MSSWTARESRFPSRIAQARTRAAVTSGHVRSRAAATGAALRYDVSMFAGGLMAFFATNRPGGTGGADIWQAQRATLDSAFVVDGPVVGVNSTAEESFPRLPDDGLEVFFQTNRDAGQWELYRATRGAPGETFGPPQLLTGLGVGDKWDPAVTPDGLALYYSALILPGLGDDLQHVLVARRPDRGAAFGEPELVPGIATYGQVDAGPTTSADERVVLFHSARPGGAGDLDIWFATRASASEPFDTPLPLASLNTPAADWKPYLRPDGCELYFGSNRTGNWELYRTRVEQ